MQYQCEDCGAWFDVTQDDVGDAVRCASCGFKQVVDPTDVTTIDGSADAPTGDDAGGGAGSDADAEFAVEGGATVTITIEITVEPGTD